MNSARTDALWARMVPVLERQGIDVPPARRSALDRYAALLLTWNRRINLVGARTPEDLYLRHLLDCLMVEAVPRPATPLSWLDVGAGAGLPAVSLALAYPADTVTAVDTVAKKVTFVQHAARTLGLANLYPQRRDVHAMARDAAAEPAGARFDRLIARAFAELDVLLGLGSALLRPGGELWAMKGRRLAAEQAAVSPAHRSAYAAEVPTFAYTLPDGGEGTIAVYRRLHTPHATGA